MSIVFIGFVVGIVLAFVFREFATPNGDGSCYVTYPCAGPGVVGLAETFETDHVCVGTLSPRP